MADRRTIPELIQRLNGRMAGMRTDRYSWWLSWSEIAQYILPRRYRWLVTPNQMTRGLPLNGAILDSTGTIAARNCAGGLMAGMSNPSRPWFKLEIEGVDRDDTNEGAIWLDEVERRMMRVLQESNFYNAIAVLYMDLVVFNTATMLIYEDFDDVIRCYNPCAGEYYLANSDRMIIDSFYREFINSVAQVGERWDPANMSEGTREALRQGGAALAREIAICHAIEPNDGTYGIPDKFKWREVYWERGFSDKALEVRGFYEFPCIAPRWDVVGNDAYGRGPGMDALPDIKQLQQETKRKAQAIDKMVNPPMIADVQMKNQPASLIPGGITFVAGLTQTGNPGMRPIYQVQPQIEHMMKDIAEIQQRIGRIFFNDLFLMISELNTVRSATEIDARREEKIVMLGPVIERFENEALDPALRRVFAIMTRANLVPPPPESIQGRDINVRYVSMLSQAQKAVQTAPIERILAVAGNMSAVYPDIKDVVNPDRTIRIMQNFLGAPPLMMNSPEETAEIREARNAAMAAQAQQAQLAQLAAGAQTLSETDVGGGKNALSALLGTSGGGV